ncbi:hypothetical protein ACTI_05280 [Actinoplanes sp. OR16]|uniref:hypothetical protein n=1 Tax=Actinoplanes sp. OR16 TaxID=946334 RepID=UPI000F6D4BEF|nr:hypothetical protein [Actinoplanes sp. OR16]BBH63843.1 hypothetical protein ACTI_05280 [Actinoplanes sp. OR16]
MSRLLPAALALLVLAGCSSGDWDEARPAPVPIGALGAGFVDPSHPPAPEATITPSPGSWDQVHPPEGYRVVLLTIGADAPTTTVVTAVEEWAEAEKVSLRTVTADPAEPVDAIVEAMNMKPDVVVSAGDGLIDPLALVTPNHLDQQFLVVGAELAEPTANVTAVEWAGAGFRGEGLGSSTTYDAATFTAERCARAVRAGAAAVLHRVRGIVLWVD